MKITGIIISKNNADKIGRALKSLDGLAEEIVVVDTGSVDETLRIAKKYGARVFEDKGKGYSDWRNRGLKEARGEWVFYLDSDEEVSDYLATEIRLTIDKDKDNHIAYAIPRKNIILGREMMHGGWWPDYVKRLFKKDALGKWEGDLHEEPVFEGAMGHLKNPIVHYKHDKLSEMVEKTNKWSEIEAKLLFGSGHPTMSWWRFIRIMLTEAWYRLVIMRGFLDGTEGIIYSIYQMWSKFVTYGKLWEMQKAWMKAGKH